MGVECHFPKLGCSDVSFPKRRECQCNLPFFLIKVVKDLKKIATNNFFIKCLAHVLYRLYHEHFFPHLVRSNTKRQDKQKRKKCKYTYIQIIKRKKKKKKKKKYSYILKIKSWTINDSHGSQVLPLLKHLQIFYDSGSTIANHWW